MDHERKFDKRYCNECNKDTELPYEYFDAGFKTGQCYTDNTCIAYRCRKCGADKLYVGSDEYYTAIKCPNCLWEECIHDG